jgi:hypothetical protein
MHTIRTRPPTYFTGRTPDGKQVLLGWRSDFIAILLFDQTGTLLERRAHPLGIDLRKGLGPAVEAIADAKIRAIKKEIGFSGGPIRVQPFFIHDWRAGIKPFPEDLEDFLSDPSRFPEEDAEIFRADIKSWLDEGNCVLRWGNDYLLGPDGRTL